MTGLLRIVLASLTSFWFVAAGAANPWPEKPLRVVVPFSAGGPTDTLSRAIGQHLSQRLGQSVLVENRAGAAGGIGSSAVAKSPPDGYTILFGTIGTHAINPHMYTTIGYDSLNDFSPISTIVNYSLVLVVGRDLAAKSMADIVAIAREKPGSVTFGSSGVGASNHMLGEIISLRSGAKMTHVPYKGDAPALIDVIGGRITFLLTSLPTALQNEKAGRVRTIATSGRTRHPDTPNLPTILETVPGVEFVGWFGFFAPAGTPRNIVDRLASELKVIMALPDMKGFLTGLDPVTTTPEEFTQRIKADHAAWAEIVKQTGVRLE